MGKVKRQKAKVKSKNLKSKKTGNEDRVLVCCRVRTVAFGKAEKGGIAAVVVPVFQARGEVGGREVRERRRWQRGGWTECAPFFLMRRG